MSTKAKIQKVRNEVQAHEDRGWLKGYEEGLAVREEQTVTAQAALEKLNAEVRALRAKKPAPTTAREALDLAWELAHHVEEGLVIPKGTECLARFDDGYQSYKTPGELMTSENRTDIRTLDPLPEQEPEQKPDWLTAPAIMATCTGYDEEEPRLTIHVGMYDGDWRCVECSHTTHWRNLRDITPLYPKKAEQDEWCRAEHCTWRHWRSGSFPTHKRGDDCPKEGQGA